ncbi:MgtE integral membrane protein [Thermincola ferriacetica]|uniref:MgtE integral membrane protein n=1 Tax=Thermincola ferriacetica TaxID=281456 RepID=A0A0L6W672_9FIRM|nr:hypothetical protein [Thermincola ferriacetica]KNZ70883.1 MgtE integral membrane protein [Thermincola ferriacetica]
MPKFLHSKPFRILKKILLILFLLALIFGFIAAVLWALDFTGVLNVQKMGQKIPVVGKYIADDNNKQSEKSPLQLENEQLRMENRQLKEQLDRQKRQLSGEIEDIKHKLAVAEEKNKKLAKDKQSLQNTVDSLQEWKSQQEGQTLSYESLGRYYAEMKPDKAAQIMNNLPDDVTIGILLNLEDEQVTAILSAMDPKKAASIVDQMRK